MMKKLGNIAVIILAIPVLGYAALELYAEFAYMTISFFGFIKELMQ